MLVPAVYSDSPQRAKQPGLGLTTQEHPGASMASHRKDKMADNKYGDIYTEDEVVEIVRLAKTEVLNLVKSGSSDDEIDERFSEGNIREVARTEIERVFHPGEPLFVLRGQDKRALGAVRWYRDHQWPGSKNDHIDSIDEALARFEAYRKLGSMKEPD
jgi:hypothetical protein